MLIWATHEKGETERNKAMKKYRLVEGKPADRAVKGTVKVAQAVAAGTLLWWPFVAYGLGWFK